MSVEQAQANLKKSLEKGILKIMSKMGISLLSCYHGAQVGVGCTLKCVRRAEGRTV